MSTTGVPEGWVAKTPAEFPALVGPFYYAPQGGLECGFLADARHGNQRGVVHGGMLATAFDVGLGEACFDAVDRRPCATVQLNVHFIGALTFGEFARVRAEIVRITRTLIFVRGVMTAGDRVIATADGVWKMLKWRAEPEAGPLPTR